MNCLHIAHAASFCDANFSAILYAELAALESADQSKVETNYLLKKSYHAIGQTDAIPAFLDPLENRIEYLSANKMWSELLLHPNRTALMEPEEQIDSLEQLLKDSGLYSMAQTIEQRYRKTDFECMWRLGDWTALDTRTNSEDCSQSAAVNFEKYHYFSMKSLREKDEINVKTNVNNARAQIIKMFKSSSYECVKDLHRNMMHLTQLQEIEDFSDVRYSN